MLEFADEGPDYWENVVDAAKANPGKWGYLEDVPRSLYEHARRSNPHLLDKRVEIKGRGLDRGTGRWERVWVRWMG